MSGTYQLPNPNSPATSDALTSLAIRQNFQSIQSQINNADGGALQTKTTTENALADAINPRLARTEAGVNFVASGFLMSVPGSSLSVSLPSGTAYVNGYRVVYLGTTLTVTASQDTYIDLTSGGAIVQTGVANNAAAPALTAGNLRLAKIVAGASAITAITQPTTVTNNMDSLGNPIYPTAPIAAKALPLALSSIGALNGGGTGAQTGAVQIGLLKIAFGTAPSPNGSTGWVNSAITFPSGLFSSVPMVFCQNHGFNGTVETDNDSDVRINGPVTTSGFTARVNHASVNYGTSINWIAIGF